MGDLVKKLAEKAYSITTAESCTGGLIAAAITDIPGASSVFNQGFITYSNDAKHRILGVRQASLDTYGAVSEETAEEMAAGALQAAQADIAIAVTGIAGPGGGSTEKPVGLVYIGIATQKTVTVFQHHFDGDRQSIRQQTVRAALDHADSAI